MPGVVRREHDLVPEQAQEHGRRHPPLVPQRREEQGEERAVPRHLLAVLDVPALVEALVADLLVQVPVLGHDVLLRGRVEGRVGGQALVNLLLDGPVGVLFRAERVAVDVPCLVVVVVTIRDVDVLLVRAEGGSSSSSSSRGGGPSPQQLLLVPLLVLRKQQGTIGIDLACICICICICNYRLLLLHHVVWGEDTTSNWRCHVDPGTRWLPADPKSPHGLAGLEGMVPKHTTVSTMN